MGQDKRRQVVGHTYGPSKRRQIMFFVAVGAVLVVIVGGWLALVALFDKPPTHFKDTRALVEDRGQPGPGRAAERQARSIPAEPCGEPGNPYPMPAAEPLRPALEGERLPGQLSRSSRPLDRAG